MMDLCGLTMKVSTIKLGSKGLESLNCHGIFSTICCLTDPATGNAVTIALQFCSCKCVGYRLEFSIEILVNVPDAVERAVTADVVPG